MRSAVIVGAGPAGLAAAIAMRRAGFEVSVHERGDGTASGGTGLTLWPNGLAALDRIGAADAVARAALPAAGMAMWSREGRVLYDVAPQVMDTVGGNGIALHRSELLSALRGLLEPDTVRYGSRCTGFEADPDGVTVSFATGERRRADVLLGADGIRSAVRAHAGLGGRLRYGGFTVWRAAVEFALPPGPGLLSLGGDGQFGIWRLPGNRVYWFASTSAGEGTASPRPPTSFDGWHEPIPALLAATPTDRIVLTDIYDSRPLRSWSRGRVALVGDAAHPSLPNMGQGTSQAFEDAVVLAECLGGTAGNGNAHDVGGALRRYQARRERRARATYTQARMLARLGGWRNPAACWLRERLISNVPASAQTRQLKQMFAFSA